MDLEFIKYEKRDRIAYITIDRPRSLNAIHHRRATRCDGPSWTSATTPTCGSPC